MEIVTTIIGALIGGCFTIFAAFITRGYIIKKVDNPTFKISWGFRKFVEFFSVFQVSNVMYYKFRPQTTYTDEKLRITFIINTSLILIFEDKSIKSLYNMLGAIEYFSINGVDYRIMIIKPWSIGYEKMIVELRKIGSPKN